MRRSIWGGILAVFCKDLAVGMLRCNLQKSTRRLSKPRAEGAYDPVLSSPACLQALGLPLFPKLYDILIFPFSAPGLVSSSQSHVHEHEGVCVCVSSVESSIFFLPWRWAKGCSQIQPH